MLLIMMVLISFGHIVPQNIEFSLFRSTGVMHERQEVNSTVSPRVKSSSPVRGKIFAEYFYSNTILSSMPELYT